MPGTTREYCNHCSSPSDPAEGVYLALLYPLERFCSGCGRRERHCSCPGRTGPVMRVQRLRARRGELQVAA